MKEESKHPNDKVSRTAVEYVVSISATPKFMIIHNIQTSQS